MPRLGLSQMQRLDKFVTKRHAIAKRMMSCWQNCL